MSWDANRVIRARLVVLLLAAWTAPTPARCAEGDAADAMPEVPGGAAPQLRLETGGPTAYVAALAFQPRSGREGEATLYVAGWDKRVDVWRANRTQQGRLRQDVRRGLRIPIGPHLLGTINAMAVAPDGGELAVGGNAVARGLSDAQHPGWIVPREAMSSTMSAEQGTLYLFDTASGAVRQMAGNRGRILALTYALGRTDDVARPRILISAAAENRAGPQADLVIQARDTGSGKLLGEQRVPFRQEQRPALAAWRFGAKPEQLAVAISAGQPDELLRVWNLATEEVYEVPDFDNNKTVVYWPLQNKLITGGSNCLTLWELPANVAGPPRRINRWVNRTATDLVPHAITLFRSRPDGPLDRLATIAQAPRDREDHLLVADLSTGRLPTEVNDQKLWKNVDQMPVIAASHDGQNLALAGAATHDVRLYQTSRLLAGGRDYWSQTLRSPALKPRRAAFVRWGERIGVLLSSDSPDKTGGAPPNSAEQVFDPAARMVTNDLGGWQISQPPLRGWVVKSGVTRDGNANQRWLQTYHNNRLLAVVRLEDGLELTASALLPPTEAAGTPILAVALHELGQPELRLYDAASGVFFRQLNGHVERIHSLAFDSSGKLLMSAAADQTVRVWSMLDVRDSLGTCGSLPGLAVAEKADDDQAANGQTRLIVKRIDRRQKELERLQVGDEIRGVVVAGELQPLSSAFDFYQALLEYQPGQRAVLRCSTPGEGERDLELVVGQATDVRMPLFSLYVTQPQRSMAERSPRHKWIGWVPAGEYEASGRDAEQHMVWHFNTGRLDDPVRVAVASEYRKLRRPGLLSELLASGKPLGPPPPPPPPNVSLHLQPAENAQPMAGRAHVALVNDPETRLAASIDDFDINLIESVEWASDDGDGQLDPPGAPLAGEMNPLDASRRDWTSGEIDWRRGARRFRVTVTTREEEPRRFEAALDAFYSPRPPSVRVESPASANSRSIDKIFAVRGVVESGTLRHSRLVALLEQRAGDKRSELRFEGEEQIAIDKEVTLEKGDNFFRLSASNADAPEAALAAETSPPLEFVVSYDPAAPSIAVAGVSSHSRRMLRQRAEGDEDDPLDVDEPTLRLAGEITANDPLTLAQWRTGDGAWRSWKGFKPGMPKRLEVAEELDVRPGRQALEVRAQTADSEMSAASLTVNYRPKLPLVAIDSPADGSPTVESQVTISGHWLPSRDSRPFTIELFHNGVHLADAVTLDAAKNEFTAAAPVDRGANAFELRYANEWRTEPTVVRLSIVGRRPPHISALELPTQTDQPSVALTAVIASPANVPITRMSINDKPVVIDDLKNEEDVWTLKAHYEGLANGNHRLSIVAWNEDGPSAAIVRTVRVNTPKREPPRIAFKKPLDGDKQDKQMCRVSFSIMSATEIKDASLSLNGRQLLHPVLVQQRRHPGGFKLSISDLPVKLSPNQCNTLRVWTKNAAGLEAERSVCVTHASPPSRIVIKQLEADDGPLRLARGGGERLRFNKPSATARVLLTGYVMYDAQDSQLDEPAGVRMRVNSYYQIPAELGKKTVENGRSVRYWQAPLYLNARQNRVVIDLPRTVKDVRDRLDFDIDCLAPLGPPRLHLLVVGIGAMKQEVLRDEALRAVGGTMTDERAGIFEAPTFQSGHLYGPYIERALDRPTLEGYLAGVRIRLNGAAQQRGSDIFMLCYRGALVVETPAQFYLLTTNFPGAERRPQYNGLAGNRVAEMFEDSPGAQVLLLDVERGTPPRQKTTGLPRGMIRYAWLGRTRLPERGYLLAAFREAIDADAGDAILEPFKELTAFLQPNVESQARLPPILRDLVLDQSAPPP